MGHYPLTHFRLKTIAKRVTRSFRDIFRKLLRGSRRVGWRGSVGGREFEIDTSPSPIMRFGLSPY
jgi:hypothetical protein